ncbi:AraC family transcriptional regulator [Gordonia phosphorivorans]|uniref:AraC family transcriptional regulator n=1 Tax=Gordonia phosphorivorans TaxID=1056982 RepID=A0ABV6H3F4_9ACTN
MSTELDPRPRSARIPSRENDWDAIRSWTDDKYMQFDVRPVGRRLTPDSSMFSVPIGDITMTHFNYGIHVDLDGFDTDSGNVLVLTTLNGWTRHSANRLREAELTVGETFVVDCDHSRYRLGAGPDHLQLNLTVPHRLLADLALRWYGHVPDARLWTQANPVGGPNSPWLSLLAYAARTASVAPDEVATGRIGLHLQEMLAAQLLADWAERAGIELGADTPVAAPGYVRTAAQYIDQHARDLPTVTEIAAVAGVSARSLSGAFRKYLGATPRGYLIERRLQGVYRELSTGAVSVAAVAGAWGYVNMGAFAAAYRSRFGENPSQTLRRNAQNRMPITDVECRSRTPDPTESGENSSHAR